MYTTIVACSLSALAGWAIRRKAHDMLDQRTAKRTEDAQKKAVRAKIKKDRRRESSWHDVCRVCHG